MAEAQSYPLSDLPIGSVDFTPLFGNQLNKAMEDMSTAFVYSLAAQAGLQTSEPQRHDEGLDLQLSANVIDINGKKIGFPLLQVQMKATSHPELAGNSIAYRFKTRKAYEKLAGEQCTPVALFLYVMPEDRVRWLATCSNHTDVIGHGFYYSMADAPALGADDPPKIVVPLANRLTTVSLLDFFTNTVKTHLQKAG